MRRYEDKRLTDWDIRDISRGRYAHVHVKEMILADRVEKVRESTEGWLSDYLSGKG